MLVILYIKQDLSYNVMKTIVNHPCGNGLYHLFMVSCGFIIVLPTLYGNKCNDDIFSIHFSIFISNVSKAIDGLYNFMAN
jgi:hypothetical protein